MFYDDQHREARHEERRIVLVKSYQKRFTQSRKAAKKRVEKKQAGRPARTRRASAPPFPTLTLRLLRDHSSVAARVVEQRDYTFFPHAFVLFVCFVVDLLRWTYGLSKVRADARSALGCGRSQRCFSLRLRASAVRFSFRWILPFSAPLRFDT